jgi:hypothetical protein
MGYNKKNQTYDNDNANEPQEPFKTSTPSPTWAIVIVVIVIISVSPGSPPARFPHRLRSYKWSKREQANTLLSFIPSAGAHTPFILRRR